MRKLIAAMQMSVDAKVEGPDGFADWVPDWSDTYGLMEEVDACLLGAAMYPGYEQYWSAIDADPSRALDLTGKLATEGEVSYARFAARTPHYVLSHSEWNTVWPATRFLQSDDDVRGLKAGEGRSIYVVGGAETVSRILDAGLVDELRFTLHPLVAGPGKLLFEKVKQRHLLELAEARAGENGTVSLCYRVSG